MALLIFRQAPQLTGIAHHSRGDPLITNDVLYLMSYTGQLLFGPLAGPAC